MSPTLSPDRRLSRERRDDDASQLLRRAAETSSPDKRERLLGEVVELHLEVAESIASRYRRRGVAEDDLVQVAYLGLVKAARGFDVDAGHDFLAYAVPTIRGEVRRYFRDMAWVVRPPRRLQDLQARISAAGEDLSQILGRSARPSEIAASLGQDEEEVLEAMAANGCFAPTSLDAPTSADSPGSLGDLLPDEDEGDVAALEARMLLVPVLDSLSPRDRRIVFLRFCAQVTQREIAEELGITQMQVSRLLARILDDLRDAIGPLDRSLDPSLASTG
ncbi:sigma-70 family RNA polymerase sigma factor [Nocardioides sp. HDW12B]|uniref:sigma-70 family RNA polymerase sigma factor n=1 Tax=Nocardioides sp. HDW12B TaxID=2714939 RepID=UPI00140768DE|nr:sigma-70 family RNA polymerase sigma factor [Nocardioides sp. HDW12B]QIK65260.1 sigma-70 family RNA polymerase sigma factor [Nocardioides sp. HDW12B]